MSDTEHKWSRQELLGEVRVRRLELMYTKIGYTVVAPESYNHQGVDIICYGQKSVPEIVIEVTNYSHPTQPVEWKKVRRYVNNLSEYDFINPQPMKWFIMSYEGNLSKAKNDYFLKNHVIVFALGYTDLPRRREEPQ